MCFPAPSQRATDDVRQLVLQHAVPMRVGGPERRTIDGPHATVETSQRPKRTYSVSLICIYQHHGPPQTTAWTIKAIVINFNSTSFHQRWPKTPFKISTTKQFWTWNIISRWNFIRCLLTPLIEIIFNIISKRNGQIDASDRSEISRWDLFFVSLHLPSYW